jgi:hypothetical protein
MICIGETDEVTLTVSFNMNRHNEFSATHWAGNFEFLFPFLRARLVPQMAKGVDVFWHVTVIPALNL